MKLGSLITMLEQCDKRMPVHFSDGTAPDYFASWRGRYAELTLCPQPYDAEHFPQMTCGELLEQAQAANGRVFHGYKGGGFIMDENTPVWADGYGDCNYNAIVGAERTIFKLTLLVQNIEEYMG